MLIEVDSSDIMALADFILDTVADVRYQGTDVDDCKVYRIDCHPNISYEKAKCKAEEVVQKLIEQSKIAEKQPKPPEPPKPDYKTEVFDLISSRPIPGVESIEVNESQRKFAVKYQQPTANREPTWTLSELRKEIAALEAYNSSGGAFGRHLSLLEFLMSEHYIVWSNDGKPYSVEVAVDENGNPKTKE